MAIFAIIMLTTAPAADEVAQAIAKGVRYLKSQQQQQGHWNAHKKPRGATALALLTLLKVGVSPGDPTIRKGFAYINYNLPDTTYGVSLLVMALAAYQRPADSKVKRTLSAHGRKLLLWGTKWLIKSWSGSYWGYKKHSGGGDMSNTQFAVMALWSAARSGARVPSKLWYRLLKFLLTQQQTTGPPVKTIGARYRQAKYKKLYQGNFQARGWGYTGPDNVRGSMVAAGISCMLIAERGALRDPSFNRKLRQNAKKSIADGLAWLAHHFSVASNPQGSSWLYYYLYGLERVGQLANIDFIGKHDWYQEGAAFLLRKQKPSGAWNNNIVDTCFALLFLSQATDSLGKSKRPKRKFRKIYVSESAQDKK